MKKFSILLCASLLVCIACRLSISEFSPTHTPTNRPKTTKTVPAETTWSPTPSQILPTASPTKKSGIARQHIETLSEAKGSRVAGTLGETQAAQYIEDMLEKLGYTVQLQEFSFEAEGADDPAEIKPASGSSQNVIAFKPGSSLQEIVVGAHYDSVEVGKGADDNASGVGVLLEAAELLQSITTHYSVRFIAFGAEEIGLKGSSYYVEHMSESETQNTIGMINLDSLIAGDIPYVYGQAGEKGKLSRWISERALSQGFKIQTRAGEALNMPDGSPCDCSDYAPFEQAGIPFAYFEATNWDLGDHDGYTQVDLKYGVRGEIWHTEYDNVDYIDRVFPGRIDKHLHLYVYLLYEALTQYGMAP